MTEHDFMLSDRITKIRSVQEQYDLERNAYLSFSGGKDSTVLHYLVDMALPGNKIPRVYLDTGLEYAAVRSYVRELASGDRRFVIVKPSSDVQSIWRRFGYPLKSKQHSHILHIYQNSGMTVSVLKYLGDATGSNLIKCPDKLRYQFADSFRLKVSDMCCVKMKKQPAHKYEKDSGRHVGITGMRGGEGGQRRAFSGCTVLSSGGSMRRFNPLYVVSDSFIDWFLKEHGIELCALYKPPFSFKRTGCVGCPYALKLKDELLSLYRNDRNAFKCAVNLWKPVYDVYAADKYRGMDKVYKETGIKTEDLP